MRIIDDNSYTDRCQRLDILTEEKSISISATPCENEEASTHCRQQSVLHYEQLANIAQKEYRYSCEKDVDLNEESPFEARYRKLSQIQISETQKYHFAILIDSGSASSYINYGCRWQYKDKQIKSNKAQGLKNLKSVAKKLSAAGAQLDLLYDAEQASEKDCYILLIHFPDEILKEANIEMTYHRWLEDTNAALHLDHADRPLTYAEKIQNANMILTRRNGLCEGELGIISILPLHCYEFQREFMNLLMKKMNIFRIIKAYIIVTCREICSKVKKVCSYFCGCFFSRKQYRNDRHMEVVHVPLIIDVSELDSEDRYLLNSDFFVYEIRRHYGEQVALYFAYIHNYTQFLIYPTILGSCIAIGNYFFWDNRMENKFLIFGGMTICSLWAPLWSKMWRRKKSRTQRRMGTA